MLTTYPLLLDIVNNDHTSINALNRHGVFHTIALTMMSHQELMAIYGLGRRRIERIETNLHTAGLRLRDFSERKLVFLDGQLPVTEASHAELLHVWVNWKNPQREEGVRYEPSAVATVLCEKQGLTTVGEVLSVSFCEVTALLFELSGDEWVRLSRYSKSFTQLDDREPVIELMLTRHLSRIQRWDLDIPVVINESALIKS